MISIKTFKCDTCGENVDMVSWKIYADDKYRCDECWDSYMSNNG